ncbi:MAG: hypothetical protein LBK93_05390 [Rickettsiales bacterium]|jgi:hypothetical protein|nr:hypothetical protein [Rickettsiales bacterium]
MKIAPSPVIPASRTQLYEHSLKEYHERKVLRYETFYYKEIISKLPKVELNKIGEAVGVDYRVSKLIGENIFNMLLYSILEKNELSLSTIEENYCRMFNLDTRHSSIASRLKTIPIEYFEKTFLFILQNVCSSKEIDDHSSTTLQLSSKLLQLGIPCKNIKYCQKNMIKCTIATDGRFAKLLNLCTQAEGFSDNKLFREVFTVKSRFAYLIVGYKNVQLLRSL